MGRKYRQKDLINTRLLKDYASWLYCDQCNKTIGYLCYTTYKQFNFTYQCKCGNKGSVLIAFDNKKAYESSNKQLTTKKNRLHCPIDDSALLTVLQDRLSSYHFDIVCESCENLYSGHN